MLRPELVDVINSGNAWAFVGSGPSIDAGVPSWPDLVRQATNSLGPELRERLEADRPYSDALRKNEFPRCFSRIESIVGREHLEKLLVGLLSGYRTPGPLTHLVADLPFRGYITTNYDLLLEQALGDLNALGWVSVGNIGDEPRKISADVQRVVWHIHGSIDIGPKESRLALTDRDYDDLYLEDSPVKRQLAAVLSQRRLDRGLGQIKIRDRRSAAYALPFLGRQLAD